MEFVHLADGWTNDRDADVCFLAKCVVAIAISRLDDNGIDGRWSSIVQRRLNWSQSDFSKYRAQGGSIKLRILVQIARGLNSAHPDYDDLMAQDAIPQHFERGTPTARRKRVRTASTRVLRALESIGGLDAGYTPGPGREIERDADPLAHLHALHCSARGHRIEIFCVFGAICRRRHRYLS